MTTAAPRSVTAFTALLAAGAAGGAAALHDRAGLSVEDLALLAPLFACLVIAGSLQVSLRVRRQVEALDLFEAALAPVLLLFAGPVAIAAAMLAKLISQRLLRIPSVKLRFNVAQWGAATAAGSAVMAAFGGAEVTSSDLGPLAVAVAVTTSLSHLFVAAVLHLVEQRPWREILRTLSPVVAAGWLVASAVNVSFGVLFAAAILQARATAVLLAVPLLLLHWAQRAYAAARTDRARLVGLQAATHLLVSRVDPVDAMPDFLDVVRSTFGAETAELVMLPAPETGGRQLIHHAGRATHEAVAAELARRGTALDGPARIEDGAGTSLSRLLAEGGHHDALVAPVRRGGDVTAVLMSFDHAAFSGFGAGELEVFGAFALEVGAALERGALLASVVEERRKLSEIVGRSSDGIFTIDSDGRVASWNPAMEAITGYCADDMVGAARTAALRAHDGAGNDVLFDEWPADGDLPADVAVLTRDGKERWLSCSYSRTDEAGPLIVVARDVTRAREVDRLRDEFVATVSHELRTPLTTIAGFSTLLLDPPRPLTDDQRTEALQFIRKGVRRLERLITNLLEVARIEASVAPEPIRSGLDVQSICQRVVDELRESWPHRTIELRIGSAVGRVRGHELSIERILINLLSNALKFAPDGDPIEVQVGEDCGAVAITVVDHGPGIDPAEHDRIFGRFERLDLPGEQAGAGIGLYIARRLAEAMAGSLTVASQAGEGARFTVRLPAEVIDLVAAS